jgi:hypothetical protein
MKAGVSPQADNMRKILKYRGGEYSTAWKRKIAKFEKEQGKKAEKVVEKTEKVVKKEKATTPSPVRFIVFRYFFKLRFRYIYRTQAQGILIRQEIIQAFT